MSVLRSIPATESVSATNNIGAQLSHRKELFVVPIATESADIIAFLFTEETFKDENPDVHVYRNVLSNPNYRISYQDGYFTVLEKKWKTYEIEK